MQEVGFAEESFGCAETVRRNSVGGEFSAAWGKRGAVLCFLSVGFEIAVAGLFSFLVSLFSILGLSVE